MKIVLPGPREIQVDIDSTDGLESFFLRWAILKRNGISFGTWRLQESKTPNHFHVTVTVTPPRTEPTATERVLIAALLGSDGIREILNYCRVIRGRRIPIAFFEEPKTLEFTVET